MTNKAETTGSATLTSETPPYVECIQWVPRRFAGGPSPVTRSDIVMTQATIKAVRHHVATQTEASVFGLLLGRVRRDPTCGRPWALATAVQRGPAIAGEPSADTLAQILEHMSAGHEQLRESVLGWYRSHPGAGLYLSPEEAEFHQTRFAEDWGFSLILVGDAGRFTGAVFQRTDPEGLSRSAYTPFYELVDPSSEFNGTTRRTFVAWPNYETETRIVQAGHGSVSAQIPSGEAVFEPAAPARETATADEPTAPARETATADEPAAPDRETATADEPTAPAPRTASVRDVASDAGLGQPDRHEPAAAAPVDDIDVEYDKKQIERSLMAVGRSIGPAGLGDLDTPVPVGASSDPSEREEAGSRAIPGPARPAETRPEVHVASEDRSVIPIRPSHTSPPPEAGGLVGRSRRNRKIPTVKILSAAAGIVLVAVSGWFGAGIIRSQTSALAADDGSGESARSSAMAGLSLAPTDLFLEAPSSVSPDSWAEGTLEPIDSEPAGEESEPGSTDSEAVAAPPETAGAEVEASEDSSTDPGTVPVVDDPAASVEPDRTVQEPQPESQREPDAVAPPELEVGDPTVSAYEAALGIFRQEMARYESVRVEFDDGAATCNPLNLAHRGVRESFRRLEQRYRSAAESTAAPQLRSFDGAGRQAAMVETHYGLTDCPMSPM